MLNNLEKLADALQKADFGLEFTLDLITGEIEQTDNLNVEEVVYAEGALANWTLDYSHSVQPKGAAVFDELYMPSNYMALSTLRSLLGAREEILSEFKSLSVQLVIVDVHECGNCGENGMWDMCDHSLGWGAIAVLIP